MCNCKKKSCSSCSSSGDSVQLAIKIEQLQEDVNVIMENAKFLLCGHPIILIEKQDDIDQFDINGGLGFGCWEGWAICNGASHYSKKLKKNITTPNFVDRFIVQSTGNYAVGDTGGFDSIQLSVPDLPSHTHGIVDPGHIHQISDPGHDHPIKDDKHDHSSTSSPHSHTLTINGVGDHTHGTGYTIIGDNNTGTNFNALNDDTSGNSVGPGGAHTHTGVADEASVTSTIGESATGIEVLNALTGITEADISTTGISVTATGSNQAHENRPPYYAAIYIIKL